MVTCSVTEGTPASPILHHIATLGGGQCPPQPVKDPDSDPERPRWRTRWKSSQRHNMLPSFLIDPWPPQCQIKTICLSFYEVFFIPFKHKCSTVFNTVIAHLLTDVLAVVFLFLLSASAASCVQFLNDMFSMCFSKYTSYSCFTGCYRDTQKMTLNFTVPGLLCFIVSHGPMLNNILLT